MVKSYLRYNLEKCWGVIASRDVNIVFDSTGKCAITGALECVAIWNIGTGEQVALLREGKEAVTRVAVTPDGLFVAAGYSDGTIRLWDIQKSACKVTFSGHRTPITAIAFNREGTLMVSGAQDTHVIVWDLLTESGTHRLKGHRNRVTEVAFLEAQGRSTYILSSSTDSVLKVWNLEFGQCVQTLVGHRGELWGFVMDAAQRRLYTASQSNLIFVYDVVVGGGIVEGKGEGEEVDDILRLKGTVSRKNEDKVVALALLEGIQADGSLHPAPAEDELQETFSLLACQTNTRMVEIVKIHEKKERVRRKRRRMNRANKKKREREEAQAAAVAAGISHGQGAHTAWEDDEVEPEESLTDCLSSYFILKCSAKIVSFSFSSRKTEAIVSTQDNKIEGYAFKDLGKKVTESTINAVSTHTISVPGHRSDVRALALSSDNFLVASASRKDVKIWSVASGACTQTVPTGFGLCLAFVPGDRHVILGTKDGQVQIVSLSSALTVFSTQAHEGSAVWAIQVSPDKKSVVSGGADKTIRFWNFKIDVNEDGSKSLSLAPAKTMRMSDDILALQYSEDGKYLSVALLDSTVKVFFADTLKFYLSLYGHKLPVLSLDVSSDSTLMVTGSSDKNIKIWGMDFGDCHKSIFAHEDSVMQVKFVRKTHYFFSAGKDGVVKYWDADSFTQILVMPGHLKEIWAMQVSTNGNFFVTASHDFSMRVWKRTDEQVFLEEEREKAMEEAFEKDVLEEEHYDPTAEMNEEVGRGGVRTLDSINAGERLVSALELVGKEMEAYRQYETALAQWQEDAQYLKTATDEGKPLPPDPSPLLVGKTPSQYLFNTMSGISANHLEDALLVIPFAYVNILFPYLKEWLSLRKRPELVCRVLFFLLHVHQGQLIASASQQQLIESLYSQTRKSLLEQKDDIGFNRAAISHLKQWLTSNDTGRFDDTPEDVKMDAGMENGEGSDVDMEELAGNWESDEEQAEQSIHHNGAVKNILAVKEEDVKKEGANKKKRKQKGDEAEAPEEKAKTFTTKGKRRKTKLN